MTYTITEQCLFDVITNDWPSYEETMTLIEHYRPVISKRAYREIVAIADEIFLTELAMIMKNSGKPAYPQHEVDTGRTVEYHSKQKGMSKRERFAMAAMQGILSSSRKINFGKIAEESILAADALLIRLEETDE